MKRLFLMCAALLIGIGCQNKSADTPTVERVNENPFSIAQWEYTNRDETGAPVTKGLLTLPSPIPVGRGFYGTWQARYLGKIDEDAKIGPQINGGKLAGEYSADGKISLQLNPNMADNNVRLIGQVTGDSIKGTWEYSNFTGTAAKGVFEAKLVK